MAVVRLIVFVFVAIASVNSSTLLRAQAPAAPAAAKLTRKQPAAAVKPEPQPEYLVEVHTLTIPPVNPEISPKGTSCYQAPLPFHPNNADKVARALASEPDYIFIPTAPDQIAIYYKDTTTPPRLARIRQSMDTLAASDFRYAKAIRVPTGSATKIVSQAASLAGDNIVVRVVDESCLLLLSKDLPDPVTVAALSDSIRGMYWRQDSTQPTQRLFYLDAGAVARKLAGDGDAASDTSAGENYASPKVKDSASSGGWGMATGGSPKDARTAAAGETGVAAAELPQGDPPVLRLGREHGLSRQAGRTDLSGSAGLPAAVLLHRRA
jgi:hypothetical protein